MFTLTCNALIKYQHLINCRTSVSHSLACEVDGVVGGKQLLIRALTI